MAKFGKKKDEGVKVLSRTKIGELFYEITTWNDKPTLNICVDRDDEYPKFRFQQPKAEILVEAAAVIEHFAEHGELPKVKSKKVKTDDE